jgi:ParB-like chromosome segregation protein Spo0J
MSEAHKVHPLAAIFPMIPLGSTDWNNFQDDIAENGQVEPTVWEGDTLLDGRNRELACQRLGITPKRVQWAQLGLDVDVNDWVWAKNMSRRQMTEDQIAAVWTEYYVWEKQFMAERRAAREQTQFKPGVSGNPTGKAKEQVRTDSYEPALERDHASENARSTVGRVAEAAKVSHHRAAQAVKLVKAAESNPEAKKALDQVKTGEVKLKDAVKQVVPEKTLTTANVLKPTESAIRAGEEAANDSETLWRLKSLWKKTNKSDRNEFIFWIQNK